MNYELYNLVYKGGHPAITFEKNCTISTNINNLTIKCGNRTASIPINQITAVRMETQDQVENRITATRLFTLGIYALAFKKKKKTTEKYLTLDYEDNNGISSTILFSGKGVPKAHSAIYEVISENAKRRKSIANYEVHEGTPSFEDIYSLREDDVPSYEDIFSEVDSNQDNDNHTNTRTIDMDPYDEIKKLKELLDMGVVTQEEFDAKKKELLGL